MLWGFAGPPLVAVLQTEAPSHLRRLFPRTKVPGYVRETTGHPAEPPQPGLCPCPCSERGGLPHCPHPRGRGIKPSLPPLLCALVCGVGRRFPAGCSPASLWGLDPTPGLKLPRRPPRPRLYRLHWPVGGKAGRAAAHFRLMKVPVCTASSAFILREPGPRSRFSPSLPASHRIAASSRQAHTRWAPRGSVPR